MLRDLGLTSAEINSGGFLPRRTCRSTSCSPAQSARDDYLGQFAERRRSTLTALNCNGNPLHPDPGRPREHGDDLTSIELAGLLGVRRVVTMSGLPGSDAGAAYPSWASSPWDSLIPRRADYQWNEVAVPFWKDIQARAADADVKVCIEMHPHNVVFNPADPWPARRADRRHPCRGRDGPQPPVLAGHRPGRRARRSASWSSTRPPRTRGSTRQRRINGVLDDRFRGCRRRDPRGLGGSHAHRWPADPSWDFVAVGRGHDVLLDPFLTAGPRSTRTWPSTSSTRTWYDPVEGLRFAADTLIAAKDRAGV